MSHRIASKFVPLLGLLLLLTLVACQSQESKLPTTKITLNNKEYTMEIARTAADRSTGLMYRDAMSEAHGMIFVFETPGIYPFWMHNTRIPLDIIWLAADGTIVDITTMDAYDETSQSNTKPALYVIEINAGQAKALKLTPGTKVTIPPL